MHHNWFNVQFSRCIIYFINAECGMHNAELWTIFFWVSRNSMKSQFLGTSVNLLPHSAFSILHSALFRWWRVPGSNRWPPACKAGALPAELTPHIRVNAECIMHNAELLALILHSSFWILHLIKLKWWAKMDSNHRPHDYQSCALASWAIGPSCLHFSGLCPLNWIT